MKRKTFLGFALSLALGVAIGQFLPQLFVAKTSSTFYYEVEWSPDSGYLIGGGGAGIYDIRDNLKTVGRRTSTLNLPLGNPNADRLCRLSQSPNRNDCIQRTSCNWFIVQYSESRYEIQVPRDCPITQEVGSIGGTLIN